MFLPQITPFLAASLALAGPAAAQPAAPADTARAYKHTFGLTASPQLARFFTANRNLPVGLLYRRQFTPVRALRLRLVGHYSRRDTLVTDLLFAGTVSAGPDTRDWAVGAFVGCEWRHPLGRRWRWGYGLEAGGGYDRQDRRYALQDTDLLDPARPIITRVGTDYVRRWTVQGRAFAAVSCALGPRLAVFAESAAVVLYADQERSGQYTDFHPDGLEIGFGIPTFRNNQYFNAFLRPVHLLGVTASF